MHVLALLLASAIAPAPDLPPIGLAQLAELQRHPVEVYRCPKADGHAFAGLTQAKALEVLGEPISTWGSQWRYRVTDGRDPKVSGAFYALDFGPDEVVQKVSCFDHSAEGDHTWTDVLTPPSALPRSVREIRAILYSPRTKSEMLSSLEKYVEPGDKLKRFERKSGLEGVCVITSTRMCMYSEAGLDLVLDEKDKVRLIRRQPARVDGIDYPELSFKNYR